MRSAYEGSVLGFLGEFFQSSPPPPSPLCGSEAEEEEQTDEEDEGDGAADVGHGAHRRDGDRHLVFPASWDLRLHPDMKRQQLQDRLSADQVGPNFLAPSSSSKFLQMINFPHLFF